MALVGELELPSFDYTDPGLRGERFHEAMRELAGKGWLAAGPYGYIVLDREAGEHFLRTRSAIFPGMKIAELFDVKEGPLYEEMERNILHVNGPDHTRLRSLVSPALSPRAVERYRPLMGELLEELLTRARTRTARQLGGDAVDGGEGFLGEGDGFADLEFVTDIAKPYPSQAIASVMGAPLDDAPRLHHWSSWIQRQFDAHSMMNERTGIEAAVEEFYEYAHSLLAARRESPGEDLISSLLAATYSPSPQESPSSAPPSSAGKRVTEKLSERECVNLVLNVLVGGVDTTQSQLAHTIRLLAEHPDQWAALVDDPTLADRAVEEALRYEPITPFTARITVEELTYRDVTFPADTVVMVCAFTANRDLPDATETAGETAGDLDAFDITADRPRARALTFGAGVHYCLGANLARVELGEALRFFAERCPRLELAGEPVFETITGIYGLAELPVRFAL
jgi:cytochrome P450